MKNKHYATRSKKHEHLQQLKNLEQLYTWTGYLSTW